MIRVMLVDDQELVRSGFRIILESEPDIEVVAEAPDGEAAVALAEEYSPDVICMDVEMPRLDGIESSRRIIAARPDTSVLILTTFGHEHYLFDALAAGVSGFLLKTSRAEQLIDAVRTLAAGDALLGADVTRAVIERVAADRGSADHGPADHGSAGSIAPETPRTASAAADPIADAAATAPATDPAAAALDAAMERVGLTEREREVLALVAEGMSNAEVAGRLFLGEATVKTHVSNLLQKLGVRDRIQAVVWAHTQG
ncbi:response regulator transcription factor [Leucobacter rhizosphaerae]|uniref:Response regulator transcription factor n=1 Tax=Leucobacter rhizosphaerae TaxID=2932245 RepID=A0ABY4FTX5_9MICO|nr:response regulator transcription factor [Leucobacter rhizosphaerae]UOQ59701.1 response regulator transcription factor [Leucobacter rhizosphaerae]